ncbi:MAG TPA: permease-like cell division protein FtsX [Nevskiaceae bacterium]|nr:permease-like cell division protein FtsX [Nevskiaceae bacterium]
MANATAGNTRPSLVQRMGGEHARVFFFSLGKLWQNPIGTLLTAAAIGITLALPAGLDVFLRNVSAVSYSWEGTLQASLFLKDSVTRERGLELTHEIQARPGVAGAAYVSREQSLAEFRELSGFGEALDTLAENPLPAVIVVAPRREQTREQVSVLIDDLSKLPEVELAKLDQKWLERLYQILDMLGRAVSILAFFLGLAVIVIVGNTIRLDIENRREEIVVMKLIGAPDSFIRRPFLYTGFWYGLLGAFISLLIVEGTLVALMGPSQRLAQLYESSYRLAGLSLKATLLLFAGGIFLGWAGALFTVSRHLDKIEPQ